MRIIPPGARVLVIAGFTAGWLLTAGAARAQDVKSAAAITRAEQGACSIDISLPASTPRATVVLQMNGLDLNEFEVRGPKGRIDLKSDLKDGDVLRLRLKAEPDTVWSDPVTVRAGGAPPGCGNGDDRDSFEASIYLGQAYNNFATGTEGGYGNATNADAPDATKTEAENLRDATKTNDQFVAGVDFQYRLFGRAGDARQLWLFGQTVHGVRTADVDCAADPKPPVCGDRTFTPDKFLFVFGNARTLEAYGGARFEFWTAQRGSTSAAQAYVTGRFGFISQSGGSQSFSAHQVGVGLVATSGPYEGSFVEAGIGRSDMFYRRPGSARWDRFKLDALLAFEVPGLTKLTGGAYGFIELYVDNTFGKGADSIQSFIGIELDPKALFSGWK